MKLLKRIVGWFGFSVKIERTSICVVCGQGPSPALGVPIATTEGTWKHLVCMLAGQQIGQAAEQASAQRTVPAERPQVLRPVLFAIVRPASPEIWN